MGWARITIRSLAVLGVGCALIAGVAVAQSASQPTDAATRPGVDPAVADEPAKETVSFISEQLIVLFTIVGAVATLPTLIEFLIERRKRRERIALSIEDEDVADVNPNVAGVDSILADMADLIDRARNPQVYSSLRVGNEILILGPSLSGKKTLAQKIAKLANLDRLITVYNPRNPDALTRAKSLVASYRRQKIMLLLPRIDLAFEKEDDELLTELDALIETTSERSNVLVVGTAIYFEPDSTLDNTFGIKIVLPGTPRERKQVARNVPPDLQAMLQEVARHYLRQAAAGGFQLVGLSESECVEKILACVNNPAEIEDIVVICQTAALYRRHAGKSPDLRITPEILQTSIDRVIVNLVSRHE